MHILIAPNAFKHSLNATQVASAIQKGLQASRLSCTTALFPIADGGNGTGELLIDRLQGEHQYVKVYDPLNRPITASFGWIKEEQTAIIEMADASGLHLLKKEELQPLKTNTYGTGQLLLAALDAGAKKIVIGIGGSATVDGGSGLVAALGVRFLDDQEQEIIDLPKDLIRLHRIDRTGLDQRLNNCNIHILCDVDNPLLGENGAAKIFGPQKGATAEDIEKLEALLSHYAAIVEKETGTSIHNIASGGAAGGVGAGLYGLLNATIFHGIDYFLDITHFDTELAKSDLLITAEGSIDDQTLKGKGPFGVAKRAKALQIPVIGLAGNVPMAVEQELNAYFDVLLAIGNGPSSLEMAITYTDQNLTRTAQQIGNIINSK